MEDVVVVAAVESIVKLSCRHNELHVIQVKYVVMVNAPCHSMKSLWMLVQINQFVEDMKSSEYYDKESLVSYP